MSDPRSCSHYGETFEQFMPHVVVSWWRRLLGLPCFAVICNECKTIIGWER